MPLKKKRLKKSPSTLKKPLKGAGFWQVFWYKLTAWSIRHKFWQRLGLGLLAFIIISTASMYGIAQWYINKNKNIPLMVGATFIPNYARYFDLNAQETMTAIVDDLGIKRLRLVSYWSDIEKDEGTYNFDELDWQMRMAEEKGVQVALAVGLRQPRWPECHMPSWAQQKIGNDWYKPLENFIAATVNRYKDSSALESYQLENEFFLTAFGICHDFNRDRLVSEYNLVKSLDTNTPVVVTMSNNAIGTPIGQPKPDKWAISVYKRVWDKTISRRYFEYPIPAWYYAFRAGFTEVTRGREVFMHELQTEAWTPDTFGGTKETPLAEQNKSLDPGRLIARLEYGQATGMKTMDMWGVEWWYWRKVKHNDSALWDTAKQELRKIEEENAKL
ncbi:beta-galactosidase [Candidatus Saccharibacteria bacterium]|nr:beta-galactosidase [Candidatus Saccharibacteria bacterium]